MIRPIGIPKEVADLRLLINEAFGTVAEEFGLSPANAASNPAFATEAEVLTFAMRANPGFFGFFKGHRMLGCYALEAKPDVVYLERLCVLPAARHGGMGRALVADAILRARGLGVPRISIGIMDGNLRLKEWYLSQGFVLRETRTFDRLPFVVRYLDFPLRVGSPA
jgi:GNAT superfamily N-acetyltransferase